MSPELINHIIDLGFIVIFACVAWGARWLYAHLPQDKQAVIQSFARQFVPGIEQEFTDLANPEKKTLAMNRLREALAFVGIKGISDAILSSAIEEAVYVMKQEASQPLAPALLDSTPVPPTTPAPQAARRTTSWPQQGQA